MSENGLFTVAGAERYFEDYVTGAVHTFGPATVDRVEMLEFASRYDPQVIHTDPEKAKDGMYGGLIASGWYTASKMMRLLATYYLSDASSLGSPGIANLRWLIPARSGDSLLVRVTITHTRRSSSKPDRGIVNALVEILNQDNTIIMDLKVTNFISCRNNPF